MIPSLVLLAAAVATPAPQQLPTIDVQAPKATLHLQVAATEEQRELGLMSVTNLPVHTGMIFVFDQDGPVDFWMKDTFIPLDMVFVGADGRVRSVAAKVPSTQADTPDDQIPRRHGDAKYVIELPAGDASKDGITNGARLIISIPSQLHVRTSTPSPP
jgi:uncharacterized protein